MAVTRQLCFGVDPDTAQVTIANSYSWASVPDLNAGQDSLSCAYSPRTKGTAINNLADTVFIGTVGASLCLRAFRSDLAQDNSSNITATIITNRIDPTRVDTKEPDRKRFVGLEFPGVNPFVLGLSVYVAYEAENPIEASTAWTALTYSTTDVRTFIPNGLCRWIHLKFVDVTAQSLRAIFGGFRIYYYRLGSRESA